MKMKINSNRESGFLNRFFKSLLYQNYDIISKQYLIVYCLIYIFISASSLANAEESPKKDLLKPGKIDYHFSMINDNYNNNLIIWTPIIKAGYGITEYENGEATKVYGGYIRPLLQRPNFGELIVGFLNLDAPNDKSSYEVQGEYRTRFGLGIGGGLVEKPDNEADINFTKLSYRNRRTNWNYILAIHNENIKSENSNDKQIIGGQAAIFSKDLMITFGADKEQIRSSLGYISPFLHGQLKPAAEILFVDYTPGDINGPQVVFINATLKYNGGFLSHSARLGRAMGPTGLEYGNPLGYINFTWNRRLDVWELGGIGDFRFEYKKLPNNTKIKRYEVAILPFQLIQSNEILNGIFLGSDYINENSRDNIELSTGFHGHIKSLLTSVKFGYDLDNQDKTIIIGAIYFIKGR